MRLPSLMRILSFANKGLEAILCAENTEESFIIIEGVSPRRHRTGWLVRRDFGHWLLTALRHQAAAGLALCLGSLLLAAPAAAQSSRPAATVEAVTLTPQPLVDYVSSVGALASEASIIVRSEIAGRVKEIGFIEGTKVQTGDVLIRLDDAIYQAELGQAKARRDLSRLNYDRANALNSRGHSSAQALDVAREEVRVTDAMFELAQARLDKTVIKAPFDGIVGLTEISIGDYIEAGDDIVNLEQIDTLKVDFRLPERYLRVVAVSRLVEVTLDALPGETHTGEVYAIDPRIRNSDRSIGVRARLENREGRLRPGLFARIRLIVDRHEQAIIIPEEALIPRGDRRFVYRIVEGKAVLTEVKIGLRQTGRVEIVDGLTAGEVIVTAGHIKLRDGSPVRVLNTSMLTPTAAASSPDSGS
jgi:membrane fusion protein, multidrug efflux system